MAATLVGSSQSGSSDTLSSSKTTAVPTGSAIDDLAELEVDVWTSSASAVGVTWPAGFIEVTGGHTSVGTGDGTQHIFRAYKQLTAADTGTYNVGFTLAGSSASVWNLVHCTTHRGLLASGDPIDGTPSTATAASGTSIPSTSATTSTQGVIIHSSATYQGVTATPPTNWTELQDSTTLHTNNRILSGTGSFTASGGTVSASSPMVVSLVAYKLAGGGGTAITPATEADTAVAPGRQRIAAPSPAAETDTAVAPARSRTVAVPPAGETDTAVAPTQPGGTPITPAAETDTAVAPSRQRLAPATPATEADQALSPARQRLSAAPPAVETDIAQTPAQTRAKPVTPAVETDEALAPHNPNEVLRDLDLLAVVEPARFTVTVEPARFRTEIA